MYKKELDEKLRNGATIRAIALYGDSFLVGYYGELITQNILQLGTQDNSLYFSEYSYGVAHEILAQNSLFSGENFLRIKIDKKMPKKDLKSILELLKKNKQGFLVLEFYQSSTKTPSDYARDCREIAECFKGLQSFDFYEVRFFATTLQESLMILRQRADKLKLQIDNFLLRRILEWQNFHLELAYGELEKFTIFETEITKEILESLGYGMGEIEFEEILVCILQKGSFYGKLKQFLEYGFETQSVIVIAQRFFYQLFLFQAHTKIYGPNSKDSTQILGYKLPPTLLQQKNQLATLIKQSQFAPIFILLEEWREETRTQGSNKELEIISFLIKLQAIFR